LNVFFYGVSLWCRGEISVVMPMVRLGRIFGQAKIADTFQKKKVTGG
jgi:hypothetical protein